MLVYWLKMTLESDTTFGRGDGVAGLVDAEVQHDVVGLPFLAGRTLKGLLASECEDLVFALLKASRDPDNRWRAAADGLFGVSGAMETGAGQLHVGPASLPDELRAVLAYDIEQSAVRPGARPPADSVTRADVLDTLTVLRRQTAMDESGAPRPETLRTFRAVTRGLTFTARLTFDSKPSDDELALLAATVKALRRVGTSRNRGRGKVRARLCDAQGTDITDTCFELFSQEVRA